VSTPVVRTGPWWDAVDAPAVTAFVSDHLAELSPLSRREALAWLDRRR
jgi:hypothetical protein